MKLVDAAPNESRKLWCVSVSIHMRPLPGENAHGDLQVNSAYQLDLNSYRDVAEVIERFERLADKIRMEGHARFPDAY